MKPTMFLLAPSDDRSLNPATREAAGDGLDRVEILLWGTLPILPFIESDETLKANSEFVLLGAAQVTLPSRWPGNQFNLVGDADASPRALGGIAGIANRMQPRRLFNQPAHVVRTARARLPQTLSGIAGCRVPRTQALQAADFDALLAACDSFGCWPLIARAAGYHRGRNMLLLQGRADLEAARDEAWLYDPICLSEYVDYRGADSLYQVNRVIVIDGKAYPRHAICSTQWLVVAERRSELMTQDRALRQREEQFLARELAAYDSVFEAIGRRLGLDVFGIDFAVKDGELLVFEANACMNFLDSENDERFDYLNGHVREIRRALKRLLMQG